MRTLKVHLALCALLSAVSPLHAETAAIPVSLSPSLRYAVSGEIKAACTLTQDTREVSVVGIADPQTDAVRPTSTDLGFAVDCNSRMLVRMQSQRGGLQFSGPGTSDNAFVSLVPYKADLELPGAGRVLECRSSAMTADQCAAMSVGAVMSGRGRVIVRTDAQDRLLLAGDYADRVMISLTPLLGGEPTS